MPNAHKWRPILLIAAAAAALLISMLGPRPVEQQPSRPTQDEKKKTIAAASRLNIAAAQLLQSAPLELRPALLSTIAAINAQIAEMLESVPRRNAPEPDEILRILQRAKVDLAALQQGNDPLAGRTGEIIRGYESSIGGLQGYTMNIPADYRPGKPMPVAVALHGFGSAQRWILPSATEYPGMITVAPRAFGQTDFKFIGEQDVLDVLDDVRRHYAIDEDRIYLLGGSMGGTGCWALAVHYPDVFAGIAPVMGHADFRVWATQDPPMPEGEIGRLVHFVRAAASPTFLGANLANMPIYCLHGSDDTVVPVESSRWMLDAVRAVGNSNVVYWEFPGFTHGRFPTAFTRERIHWLARHPRVREPQRVIYTTASMRHAGAWWITIEERPLQAEFSKVDASIDQASIRVSTSNVARFRIDTPQRVRDADEITVTVDGSIAYKGSSEPELVFASDPEGWQRTLDKPGGLNKRPGMSGPIEDAFMSRFMIVHGTGHEQTSGALANLVARWKQQIDFPVKPADAVTDDDIAAYNLIVIGSPESNKLMARIMPGLPVRLEGSSITCGDRTWSGQDLGLKLCYPNPLNPERYVVVIASTGYNGMLGINSRFGNWFRWIVHRNRDWFDYAVFDDRTFGPETFLEVGFFDSHWKPSDSNRWNRPDDYDDADEGGPLLPARADSGRPLLPARAEGTGDGDSPSPARDESGRGGPLSPARLERPRRVVPSIPSIDDAPDTFSLSSLRPAQYLIQKGFIGFDQTPDGRPLIDSDGNECTGLMMLAPASITYALNGAAGELTFTPCVPPNPPAKVGAGPSPAGAGADEESDRIHTIDRMSEGRPAGIAGVSPASSDARSVESAPDAGAVTRLVEQEISGLFFVITTEQGKIYESPPLLPGGAFRQVTVPLHGSQRMTLHLERAGGRQWQFINGAWLNATVTKAAATPDRP